MLEIRDDFRLAWARGMTLDIGNGLVCYMVMASFCTVLRCGDRGNLHYEYECGDVDRWLRQAAVC